MDRFSVSLASRTSGTFEFFCPRILCIFSRSTTIEQPETLESTSPERKPHSENVRERIIKWSVCIYVCALRMEIIYIYSCDFNVNLSTLKYIYIYEITLKYVSVDVCGCKMRDKIIFNLRAVERICIKVG